MQMVSYHGVFLVFCCKSMVFSRYLDANIVLPLYFLGILLEMMCSSKTIVVLEMSKINVFVRQQTYVFGYKKSIKQSVFGRRLSRVVCSVWEISSYSSGLVGSEPITMGLLVCTGSSYYLNHRTRHLFKDSNADRVCAMNFKYAPSPSKRPTHTYTKLHTQQPRFFLLFLLLAGRDPPSATAKCKSDWRRNRLPQVRKSDWRRDRLLRTRKEALPAPSIVIVRGGSSLRTASHALVG